MVTVVIESVVAIIFFIITLRNCKMTTRSPLKWLSSSSIAEQTIMCCCWDFANISDWSVLNYHNNIIMKRSTQYKRVPDYKAMQLQRFAMAWLCLLVGQCFLSTEYSMYCIYNNYFICWRYFQIFLDFRFQFFHMCLFVTFFFKMPIACSKYRAQYWKHYKQHCTS